jgi:hypothetical protein
MHLFESNLNNDPNKMKTNKIRKIIKENKSNPITIKYKENITEQEALILETKMIEIIGRIDLKTGPLTNLIEGGSQPPSWKGKHHSEKTKQKLSEINKGENNPNFGKSTSKEIKRKISKSMIGKNTYKRSEETKKRIAKSLTGKLIGENNPNYGNKWSDKQKKKQSELLKNKNSGIKHPICNKYIYKFIDKNYKIYDNIDRPVLFCKEHNLCYNVCATHEKHNFKNGWYFERKLK